VVRSWSLSNSPSLRSLLFFLSYEAKKQEYAHFYVTTQQYVHDFYANMLILNVKIHVTPTFISQVTQIPLVPNPILILHLMIPTALRYKLGLT
jgi:hypothetical protein